MQDASVSSQFGYPHIFIKYVYLMRKKKLPKNVFSATSMQSAPEIAPEYG
jgi:hypothetical protein